MGWDEIRVRTVQALAKLSDFTLYRMGIPAVNGDHRNGLERRGHFFFQKEQLPEILASVLQSFPETAEQIVERAEQLCQHRFDLLGYQGVNYGPEIDWHLDAVHGKRAPLRPWFRIPYLDFDEVGDSKVIWELNRHQHLVTLAKAYRLTEEEIYGRELFQQWYHWREKNPYPMGINWASSLEVAFRSLSWLWVWHLLDGCSVVPKQFGADLSHALALNARHIQRFLSTYFSPNTHLLGEGVGLFFVGLLCPGLPSARNWRDCGWKIILTEAQRQIRPDGMHFEQSMYYHTYALDFFLHSRILAQLNQIPVPQSFDETIEKMLETTVEFAAAGSAPRFGDDDGGRVFDPSRDRQKHILDPLVIGSVLYDRPDFKTGSNQGTEELLWLFGVEGMRQFKELPPQKRKARSFAMEAGGIYLMRSSGPTSYQLVVDAGPQGAGRSGHGHADALSVQLTANGKPLLIDPGTFTYADPFGERDWFRGTSAHNTIQVDGTSQADPAGPFEWEGRANGTVDSWITGKMFDFFVGAHNGYSQLPSPVQHRRFIFHLKSRFWVIRDVLDGTGMHKLAASWHFAPGSLHAIPEGALFVGDDAVPLALLFNTNSSCRKEISQDWYSPVYGKKEVSPTFRVTTHASLPAELTTMLIPHSEVMAHLGFLRPVESGHTGASVKAFRYSTALAQDLLFFADEPGNWQVGPCASNAKFLYCSIDNHGTVAQFVICGGSYLVFGGRRLFDASLPVKHSEWSRDSSELEVSQPLDLATRQESGTQVGKRFEQSSSVRQYLGQVWAGHAIFK
jgi:hypothetical protein